MTKTIKLYPLFNFIKYITMKVGLLSVPFEFNPLKDVDGLRAQVSAKLVKEIAGCMLTGLRG